MEEYYKILWLNETASMKEASKDIISKNWGMILNKEKIFGNWNNSNNSNNNFNL